LLRLRVATGCDCSRFACRRYSYLPRIRYWIPAVTPFTFTFTPPLRWSCNFDSTVYGGCFCYRYAVTFYRSFTLFYCDYYLPFSACVDFHVTVCYEFYYVNVTVGCVTAFVTFYRSAVTVSLPLITAAFSLPFRSLRFVKKKTCRRERTLLPATYAYRRWRAARTAVPPPHSPLPVDHRGTICIAYHHRLRTLPTYFVMPVMFSASLPACLLLRYHLHCTMVCLCHRCRFTCLLPLPYRCALPLLMPGGLPCGCTCRYLRLPICRGRAELPPPLGCLPLFLPLAR